MRGLALALAALTATPAGLEVTMQKPDLDWVLGELRRIEGGYANTKGDAGGETWYGVSERYSRAEYERTIGPWPPTEEGAKEFFRRRWQASGIGELPVDDRTAAQLFFFQVHKDQETMTRLLQAALCQAGEPVKVDGRLGPKTRLAVAYADPSRLYDAFVAGAAGWYIGAPTWERFGESFLRHRLRMEVGD